MARLARVCIGGYHGQADVDAIAVHLTASAHAGTLLPTIQHYLNMKVVEIPGYVQMQTLEDDGDLGQMRVGRHLITWNRFTASYQAARAA